jgi:hypothetical protein
VLDLNISPDTPSGTIGLSVSVAVAGQKFAHQNGVFWIILPEMKAQHYPKPLFDSAPSPLAIHAFGIGFPSTNVNSVYPALAAAHRNRVMRSTVQITLSGNFSLGTGFFVANSDLVVPIFGAEAAAQIRSLPATTKFILTAAHLFPTSYGSSHRGQIHTMLDTAEMVFDDGETYDLLVGGKLATKAARLLVTNMESDLALLALTHDGESDILNHGVLNESDLIGLSIARDMSQNVALDVFGYPVSGKGAITHRRGYLPPDGWPTDDTSNFGPLRKFKLQAIDTSINLAEAGLSGGPIVNASGEVVGLSMERPNDTNSLVAIDLTSFPSLPVDWLAPGSDCSLTFNPFDRVLRLIRNRDDCSYGRFGSPKRFAR